jgi:hypothetical protein
LRQGGVVGVDDDQRAVQDTPLHQAPPTNSGR